MAKDGTTERERTGEPTQPVPAFPLMRLFDALALIAIIQSYWGIDIAAYAPQLIGPPLWFWSVGLYWWMMYVQGIIAAVYLFVRVRR